MANQNYGLGIDETDKYGRPVSKNSLPQLDSDTDKFGRPIANKRLASGASESDRFGRQAINEPLPDPVEPPAPSIGNRIAVAGKAAGLGLAQAPLYFAQSVGGMIESKGVPLIDESAVSRIIEGARDLTSKLNLSEEDRAIKVLPGLSAGDVQQGVGMAGYSAAHLIPQAIAQKIGGVVGKPVGTALGGLVGPEVAAVGAVAGKLVGGQALGMAVGYQAAKRSDMNMILREKRDQLLQINPNMTAEEWESIKRQVDDAVEKHGTAEGAWEAGGNALQLAIMSMGHKWGTKLLPNARPRLAKAMGIIAGIGIDQPLEIASEAKTEQTQDLAEKEMGLRDPGPALTFPEAVKNVAGPTLVTSAATMGLGGAASAVMDRTGKRPAQPQPPPIPPEARVQAAEDAMRDGDEAALDEEMDAAVEDITDGMDAEFVEEAPPQEPAPTPDQMPQPETNPVLATPERPVRIDNQPSRGQLTPEQFDRTINGQIAPDQFAQMFPQFGQAPATAPVPQADVPRAQTVPGEAQPVSPAPVEQQPPAPQIQQTPEEAERAHPNYAAYRGSNMTDEQAREMVRQDMAREAEVAAIPDEVIREAPEYLGYRQSGMNDADAIRAVREETAETIPAKPAPAPVQPQQEKTTVAPVVATETPSRETQTPLPPTEEKQPTEAKGATNGQVQGLAVPQVGQKPPELMTPEDRKNAKRQVIAVTTEKGLAPDYIVAVRNGANIEFRPANTKEADYGTVIPASDNALGKPLAVASVDDVLRAGGAPAYLEQIAKSEGKPIYRAEGIGVQKAHEAEMRDSILARRPLSSTAVDQYGIKLPPGYVRSGDQYVYKPTESKGAADGQVQGQAEEVGIGDTERQARDVGNDPVRLKKRLQDAYSVLTNQAKRRFGKITYDLENKRIVSEDGKAALQWRVRNKPDAPVSYNNQQTSVGSVFAESIAPPAESISAKPGSTPTGTQAPPAREAVSGPVAARPDSATEPISKGGASISKAPSGNAMTEAFDYAKKNNLPMPYWEMFGIDRATVEAHGDKLPKGINPSSASATAWLGGYRDGLEGKAHYPDKAGGGLANSAIQGFRQGQKDSGRSPQEAAPARKTSKQIFEAKKAKAQKIKQESAPAAKVVVEEKPSGETVVSVPSEDKGKVPPATQKKFFMAELDKAIELAPDEARTTDEWTKADEKRLKEAEARESKATAYERSLKPMDMSTQSALNDPIIHTAYERSLKPMDMSTQSALNDPIIHGAMLDAERAVNEAFKLRREKARKTLEHVTIEVPGDGTFTVVNTKANLQAIKKKMASAFNKPSLSMPSTPRGTPTPIAKVDKRPPSTNRELWDKLMDPFASHDPARTLLVKPHYNKETGEVVATDSRRLVVAVGVKAGKPVENYPNYKQVVPGYRAGKLPDVSKTHISLKIADTEAFARKLNQAYALLKDKEETVVLYKMPDGTVALEAKDAEIGDYQSGDFKKGEEIGAFSIPFLMDAVGLMRKTGNKEAMLHYQDNTSPLLITGKQEYVVQMPIRRSSLPMGDAPLVAMHNLSGENLEFAERLGGLAMPSLGIANVNKPYTGFGEITLIAKPDLIDPARSGNMVADADQYSPRYPSARYFLREGKDSLVRDTWKKIEQWAAQTYGKMGDKKLENEDYNIRSIFYGLGSHLDSISFKDNGIEALYNDVGLHAYFASQKYGKTFTNTRGGVDNGSFKEIRDFISQHEREYREWVDQNFGTFIDVKMYKGTTNAGRHRYAPYTMDEVMRELRKSIRTGEGENFFYGAGTVRAQFAKRYRSLSQIKADRGRLVDNIEADKHERNDRMFEIASKVASRNERDFGHTESFWNAIMDAKRSRDPRAKLKEYGFDYDSMPWQDINEFIAELKAMPSEYFEAKPRRVVGLSEFAHAVIPKTATENTRAILSRNRIPVIEYDASIPGDRARAVAEASELANARFSLQQAPAAPQMTQAKRRSLLMKMSARYGQYATFNVNADGVITMTAKRNGTRIRVEAVASLPNRALAQWVQNGPSNVIRVVDTGEVSHEMTHAMRDLGMINDPEWNQLAKVAREATPERVEKITKRYKDAGFILSPDDLDHELVAQYINDVAEGRIDAGANRNLVQKVLDFFRELARALGLGTGSAVGLVKRTARGEMLGRISKAWQLGFDGGEKQSVMEKGSAAYKAFIAGQSARATAQRLVDEAAKKAGYEERGLDGIQRDGQGDIARFSFEWQEPHLGIIDSYGAVQLEKQLPKRLENGSVMGPSHLVLFGDKARTADRFEINPFGKVMWVGDVPDKDIQYAVESAAERIGLKISGHESLIAPRFNSWDQPSRFSFDKPVAQIDADYMAAVERGDMATAQRIVDEAVKKKIDDAVQAAKRAMAEQSEEQNSIQVEWDYEDRPEENQKLWFPDPDIPRHLEAFDEFVPKDAINEINGKYVLGESQTRYDSLEDAQSAYKSKLQEWAKDIDKSGSFGQSMSGHSVSSKIFDAFPEHPAIEEDWGDTKWGSWYLRFRDQDGAIRKISVRDHDASRKDMGIPDKTFYVEKSWTPDDVGAALIRAWKYIQDNSSDPIVRDDQGRVIPPSERFNPQSDDIRYSLPMGDQTSTPEFKRWFGDSKVVDKDGKPLVVYHGTDVDGISVFKPNTHFGTKHSAEQRAWARDGNEIIPVYLKIENPKFVDDDVVGKNWKRMVEQAKAEGHDGLAYWNEQEDFGKDSEHVSYIAFSPTQIKSATGNRGTFDASNPDIRYSLGKDYAGAVAEKDEEAGGWALKGADGTVIKSGFRSKRMADTYRRIKDGSYTDAVIEATTRKGKEVYGIKVLMPSGKYAFDGHFFPSEEAADRFLAHRQAAMDEGLDYLVGENKDRLINIAAARKQVFDEFVRVSTDDKLGAQEAKEQIAASVKGLVRALGGNINTDTLRSLSERMYSLLKDPRRSSVERKVASINRFIEKTVLERARKSVRKAIADEMAKAAVIYDNRTGKLKNPDYRYAHDAVKFIRDSANWTVEQMDEEVERLIESDPHNEMKDNPPTEEGEGLSNAEKINLIQQFSGFAAEQDFTKLNETLEALKELTAQKVAKFKAEQKAKREYYEAEANEYAEQLGFTGTDNALVNQGRERSVAAKMKKFWNAFHGKILSGQYAFRAMDQRKNVDPETAKSMTLERMEHKARSDEAATYEPTRDAFLSVISRSFGVNPQMGRGDRRKMLQKLKDFKRVPKQTGVHAYSLLLDENKAVIGTEQGKQMVASKDNLTYIYSLMRRAESEAGQSFSNTPATVEGWNNSLMRRLVKKGYTAETKAEIESFIGQEGIDLAEGLNEWVQAEVSPKVRQLLLNKFGVVPPIYDFYVPMNTDRISGDQDITGGAAGGIDKMIYSWMKRPSYNTFDFKPSSIIDQYMRHVSEVNHAVSWMDVVEYERRVFKSRTLQEGMRSVMGDEFRRHVNEHIKRIALGTHAVVHNMIADKLTRRFSQSVIHSPTQFVKQFSAAPMLLAFAPNTASKAAMMAHATARFWLNPVSTFRFAQMMFRESPVFHNRYAEGMNIYMRIAESPKGEQYLKTNGPRSLFHWMTNFSKYGDMASAVYIGPELYDAWYKDSIKRGMDPAAAKKEAIFRVDQAIEKGLQSSHAEHLSSAQTDSFWKHFQLFNTQPVAMTRLWVATVNDIIKGRGSRASNASKLASIYMSQAFWQFAADGLGVALFGADDDDEWKRIKHNQIRTAALVPFGGYAITYSLAERFIRRMQKESVFRDFASDAMPATSVMQTFDDVLKVAAKWSNDELTEADYQRLAMAGADMMGLALSTPVAPAARWAVGMKDAIQNQTDMTKGQRIMRGMGWGKQAVGQPQESKAAPKKSAGLFYRPEEYRPEEYRP